MKRKIIIAVTVECVFMATTFMLLWKCTSLDIIRIVHGSGIAGVAALTMTLCILDDTAKILKEKEKEANSKEEKR